MPPVTDRGRHTYQALLDAAERVFGTIGYARASVVDVTREAGVAQGTFYIYFQSKLDAFRQVVRDLGHGLRTATRLAYAAAPDQFGAEVAGFRAFFQFAAAHPNLYRVLRQAESVDLPSYRDYYESLAAGYRGLIETAIARGDYVPYRNPEAVAYMLMGLGDFLGMRWILWQGAEIPDSIFEDLTQFVGRALLAVPPSPGSTALPVDGMVRRSDRQVQPDGLRAGDARRGGDGRRS